MSWLSETLFGKGPDTAGARRTASEAINPLAQQIRDFQGFNTIQGVNVPTFGSMFDVQNGGFGVREAGQQYAEQLGLMAQPQEAAAANQLANRLFSTGRLGSSGGSQQMADLAQAQQMAATQRGLQGLGFATNLQNQLTQMDLARRSQDIGIQNSLFGGLQSAAQLQAAPYLSAQQQTQGTPGILGGLGQIGQFVGGLGLAFSDIRTKENIEYIGMKNNIPMYSFEYKPEFKRRAGLGRFIGTIADDIKDTHPEVISYSEDGYMMVDYNKLLGG